MSSKPMKMYDRFAPKKPVVIQSVYNIKQMYANVSEEDFKEYMKLLQESGIFEDKILPEDKEFIDNLLKGGKE